MFMELRLPHLSCIAAVCLSIAYPGIVSYRIGQWFTGRAQLTSARRGCYCFQGGIGAFPFQRHEVNFKPFDRFGPAHFRLLIILLSKSLK